MLGCLLGCHGFLPLLFTQSVALDHGTTTLQEGKKPQETCSFVARLFFCFSHIFKLFSLQHTVMMFLLNFSSLPTLNINREDDISCQPFILLAHWMPVIKYTSLKCLHLSIHSTPVQIQRCQPWKGVRLDPVQMVQTGMVPLTW